MLDEIVSDEERKFFLNLRQLGDSAAVERSIANLNNTVFFGSKMQLGFSKQAFLADVQTPYQLPDNTPSFQVSRL